MVDEFTKGMTAVCVLPKMAIAEAAAGLYVTEPRFRP
jgi:hypothetical protein